MASAKVLYWTSLGATGMVMANGYKMTLVMVDPHLPHRGRGDRKTGECILLKKKITQHDFAQHSFSVSSYFYTRWYILLLVGDNTSTVSRISSFQCRYILLYIEIIIISHFVSIHFPPGRKN